MPNLRKCRQCNLHKSIEQFLPRHRICLDCRPLRNKFFPEGENHYCLHCQELQPIQSFVGVNNRRFQTCNQCRVGENR